MATNADLERCLVEQAELADYLRDPNKMQAWCKRFHCTEEQAKAGTLAAIRDWAIEELIIRGELNRLNSDV